VSHDSAFKRLNLSPEDSGILKSLLLVVTGAFQFF
jgi:hypothetical protein